MHITHVTDANPSDPDVSSGTLFWISKSLKQQNIELQDWYISPEQTLLDPVKELIFQCKKQWAKLYGRSHLVAYWHEARARKIANYLKLRLQQQKTNVILTSLSAVPGAFLETSLPIVYWTDNVYASLANFYPMYRLFHPDNHWDAHIVTEAMLRNAKLLIFSSEWAAHSAIQLYGISRNKIQVVPFGANLDITHTREDVQKFINARAKNKINLLFVGKEWYRKGGDIVLCVAEALHNAGYIVELTLVGRIPKQSFPSYVKCIEVFSKKNPQNVEKLKALYREAHFLFVPSRAEAYGIVFCEANAFGVPIVTTYVGGISEIVKDNINGMTFSLEATIQEYCDYIVNLTENKNQYEKLALSAFNEYATRLNWQTAAGQVKKLITDII
jgi:glycosyltransferase involved in cell wall biosynthesis